MRALMIYILLFLYLFFPACGQAPSQQSQESEVKIDPSTDSIEPFENHKGLINPIGTTIESRILLPSGFKRVEISENSFAAYLRQLPLKAHGEEVVYYNGATKANNNIYDAVVDLPIGKRDLHQCADAVMRLRAEYLFHQKQYDKIHFNFTNGFRVDYAEWIKGKRIVVKGNEVYWRQATNPANSNTVFWKYLEIIFSYAGTLSLAKEMQAISIDDLQIGDVFIQGGSPGHAIIVVDLASNPLTNMRIFLLAQSYMPAQELQLLKNPSDEKISPWYSASIEDHLLTPEWTFFPADLKRFVED